MSWNRGIRTVHRWTSIIFTLAVIIVTALVMTGGPQPAEWVYLMPLPPLAVLAITGLYLLVLPWSARLRGRGNA